MAMCDRRPSTSRFVQRLWDEDRAEQLAQRAINEAIYVAAVRAWFERHDDDLSRVLGVPGSEQGDLRGVRHGVNR